MPAPWIKGYAPSSPDSANAKNVATDTPYRAPGEVAVAVKRHWRGKPAAYPYGESDEGGGGGGDA